MHFTTSVSAVLVAASCAVASNQYDGASSGVATTLYNNHVYGRDVEDLELSERDIIDDYLFARDELVDLVARGNGKKEVAEGKALEKSGHKKAGKAAIKAGKRKEAKAKKGKRSIEDVEEDLMNLLARGNGVGEVREGLHLERTGHEAAGKAAVRAGIRKEEKASRKNTKKPRSIEDLEDMVYLMVRGNGVGEVREGLHLERTGHEAAGKAAVRAGIRKEEKTSRKNTKKPRSIEDLDYLFDLVARGNGVGEVREGLHLEKTGHEAAGKAAVRAGIRKEQKASRKNTKKPRSIETFDDEDIFDLIARGNGVGEVREGLHLERTGHEAAGKAAVNAGIRKEEKASRKAARKGGAKAPRSILLELDEE